MGPDEIEGEEPAVEIAVVLIMATLEEARQISLEQEEELREITKAVEAAQGLRVEKEAEPLEQAPQGEIAEAGSIFTKAVIAARAGHPETQGNLVVPRNQQDRTGAVRTAGITQALQLETLTGLRAKRRNPVLSVIGPAT